MPDTNFAYFTIHFLINPMALHDSFSAQRLTKHTHNIKQKSKNPK